MVMQLLPGGKEDTEQRLAKVGWGQGSTRTWWKASTWASVSQVEEELAELDKIHQKVSWAAVAACRDGSLLL